MITLVINSQAGCATGELRGSSGRSLRERSWLLRNFILPQAARCQSITQVVVAGGFEPGPGYDYVPVEGVYGGCEDALLQRHRGFQVARNDWLIFQHDDHILDPGFDGQWERVRGRAEVLCPQRLTRSRRWTGEVLNNGQADGYVMGHACVMSRRAVEAVPWQDVPAVHTWDVAHTALLRAAGMSIIWTEELRVWDIEYGAEPWR